MPRTENLTLALALAAALLAPCVGRLAADPVITVVAKVGSDIITSADIDDAVKEVELSMTPEERASPEGQKKLAEARKNVLDHMIEQKLVILAAKDGPEGYAEAAKEKAIKNPYLPDSTEVETEMEKLFDQTRQRFSDQDEFEAALAKEHVTVAEYRNRLRDRVRDGMTYERMEKIKEQEYRPSLHVTDEEAERYYNDNKERFVKNAQVNIRHILFKADGEDLAKATLAQIKKAKDPKQAFIDFARKHSEDTATRDQGGRLGWIEKGQSWPELEAAAFAAPDNSLAGPVKTDAGWHLLYVEGHQSGKTPAFEEVKKNASNLLYQEKVQKRLNEWLEELKSKYYVERQGDAAP
jgi:parvulin-like peptidyl-prolyl isomerase